MADNLQQQTTLPPSEKQLPPKRSISRRSFVVGLTGLALIEAVAGSGITWASLLQSLQSFSLVLLGTTLLTIVILAVCILWHGHLMANVSHQAAGIKRYKFGMLPLAEMFSSIAAILAVWIPWHGHLMANVSHQAAPMERYRFGKRANLDVTLQIMDVRQVLRKNTC